MTVSQSFDMRWYEQTRGGLTPQLEQEHPEQEPEQEPAHLAQEQGDIFGLGWIGECEFEDW